MAKVRITGKPSTGIPGKNSSYGNQAVPGYQPDYSQIQKPDVATRRVLKSVPKDQANIEAESGETILVPDKDGIVAHYTVGGKRHNNGGTPLNVPKDSFVFSDTKKMRIKDPAILAFFGKPKGSYTPADIAKKYDINKYRKILGDPTSDKIDVTTAEKMIANYELKLAQLALIQESKKGFPQGIPAVAMPYLATYNIQADTILPQKQEQAQEPTAMMRYGGSAPKNTKRVRITALPKGKSGGTLPRFQVAGQNDNPYAYLAPNPFQPTDDKDRSLEYIEPRLEDSPIGYDPSNANYMSSFKPGTPGATVSNEDAVAAIGDNPADQYNPEAHGDYDLTVRNYPSADEVLTGGRWLTKQIEGLQGPARKQKALSDQRRSRELNAPIQDRGDYLTYSGLLGDTGPQGGMISMGTNQGKYGGILNKYQGDTTGSQVHDTIPIYVPKKATPPTKEELKKAYMEKILVMQAKLDNEVFMRKMRAKDPLNQPLPPDAPAPYVPKPMDPVLAQAFAKMPVRDYREQPLDTPYRKPANVHMPKERVIYLTPAEQELAKIFPPLKEKIAKGYAYHGEATAYMTDMEKAEYFAREKKALKDWENPYWGLAKDAAPWLLMFPELPAAAAYATYIAAMRGGKGLWNLGAKAVDALSKTKALKYIKENPYKSAYAASMPGRAYGAYWYGNKDNPEIEMPELPQQLPDNAVVVKMNPYGEDSLWQSSQQYLTDTLQQQGLGPQASDTLRTAPVDTSYGFDPSFFNK